MTKVAETFSVDGYPRESAKALPGAVAELRGVSKSYGDVQAVRHFDLAIAPGEFLSFLGPSGCGKTTALRMLAGFEAPSAGTVLIDGKDVSGLAAYQRPVNMVFQSYALFPHLTVGQNIAYGLKQQRPKLPLAGINDKVQRVLETVRLADFKDRRIWEMSGGQQQRVALARAIVNEPKLLLLDEPLAALDRKLRKEMQIELQDLQRQLGITFVLVTHDQEEALSLSDRICVMRAGEIVQVGTPRELYDQPKSRYVADFVGTSNFFDGKIIAVNGGTGQISLSDGRSYRAFLSDAIPVGETACVSVRPEQIRMSDTQSSEALEVTIQNRIFLGEHTEYLVRHARLGNIAVMAPRQSDGRLDTLQKGDTAWVHWNPEAALILRND
ncbi:ABC transporter ATP-binding protein [uncultured Boseongicola sp.]|jgi:spermidine/putrescine transport system ATP-binding protein|uniref:ABC transporter ATP-binding protein n=1 Tax=uncultured Boseongicola sp. TaxID=1648499 RepID=UPI002624D823|nr:ABC transporter ATP-binding protein [uncultured Boseongicola sp.]